MNCEKARTLLQKAVDSELAGEILKDFETHLDDCEKCRKLFAASKKLEVTLSELGNSLRNSTPINEKLRKKIHEKINIRIKRKYYFLQVKFAVSAAALILILLCAFFIAETYLQNNDKIEPGKNIIATQPACEKKPALPKVIKPNPEKNWLDNIKVPSRDKDKFLSLGKIAGADKFKLYWNKKQNKFIFVSPNQKNTFCGEENYEKGKEKFDALLNHYFPDAEILKCTVKEPNKIKGFLVLRQ